MRSVKHEFPNPVLATGRDDYIDTCHFFTTFSNEKIVVESDDIIIPITYTLECDGLSKLIENDKAAVVINVRSSAASLSRLFRFEKGKHEMELRVPKFSVVKQFEVGGAIIAAEAIHEFRCESEFNELYFSTSTFEIRKGDILATEDPRIIYVDDSELEKPIASIFNINKVPDQEEDIIPDFSGEKIEINLKEDLYNIYYHFKDYNNGSLRRYVTGIIVYPVLIEAISKICEVHRDGDDGSMDRRWFRAIEKKAEKLGVVFSSYEDSLATIADKILGSVSLDALKNFKDTLDEEMNSGETTMIGGVD